MTIKQRTNAFIKVGEFFSRHFSGSPVSSEIQLHQGLDKIIEESFLYNNWFIPAFVKESLQNIAAMINVKDLEKFAVQIKEKNPKTVALICAGNIPMVCFHDILCVLLCGYNALIKLSSDDKILVPFFLKLLTHYEPRFEPKISFADGRLSNFDAVIATGSNNTATHFKYYFGKYPHIIRKSRTSIAIITGNETPEELKNLGKDIFLYFGLGCRNVSKLLVPENYDFKHIFENILDFGFVINNKKYGNNYDYHRAIYLMESQKFLDNNFLIIKESNDLFSPVSVLYYQSYSGYEETQTYLKNHSDEIQCVIGKGLIPFGYSQTPVITEFADNINTVNFLLDL